MSLKNIVIINDYNYVQGGASKVAIMTANNLQRLGYNVIYFCGVKDETKHELNSEIKVVGVDKTDCLNSKHKIGAWLRGIYNIKTKLALKRILKPLQRQETIVHVHGWTKDLSVSFIDACRSFKFKSLLTLHDYFVACPNGGFYNYKKGIICKHKPLGFKCLLSNCDSRNILFKYYRYVRSVVQTKLVKLIKKVDGFITISDFSETILAPYLNNKPLFRVHNPISLTKGSSRIFAESNNYYIYIGRIAKEKGIAVLCAEADKLGIPLKVLGDGPLLVNLRKQYINNAKIEFLGWQSVPKTMEMLRGARALLFPSLWYEGAPLTILEALAQGIPCVVSNVSAAIEFVNDQNGVIYSYENKNWLSNALSKIETNLKQYSENAYKLYWQNPYDLSAYTTKLIKAYTTILTNGAVK